MPDESYIVVLQGTIGKGFTPAQVVPRLAQIFKKDEASIERLLTGTPRQIIRTSNEEKALKFKKLLERAGAPCTVMREEGEPQDPAPRAPANPSPSADAATSGHHRPAEPQPGQPPSGLHRTPPPAPHEETPRRPARPAPAPEPPTTPRSGHLPRSVTEQPLTTCPRCNYQAASDEDVMLLRGDCPRCGLMVNRPAAEVLDERPFVPADLEDGLKGVAEVLKESFRAGPEPTALTGDFTPASVDRRMKAALSTFSVFLVVYLVCVLLSMVVFLPAAAISRAAGFNFFAIAATTFPLINSVLSIAVVWFVIPVFSGGLTFGQRMFGIDLLYSEEAQAGGLYLALILKIIAIVAITFVPAFIVQWLLVRLGVVTGPKQLQIAAMLTAVVSWSVCWLIASMGAPGRGILDRVAGTVQIEADSEPEHATWKILAPYLLVLAQVLFFVAIVPLIQLAMRAVFG